MTQSTMFNGRTMGGRPNVSSQTKQYQYQNNSASKTGETAMIYSQSQASGLNGGKSRNGQVTSNGSHGILGKQKSTQSSKLPGYALSPKAMAMTKPKFGVKGSSPKHQTSPTATRITPALSGNEAASRNM